VTFVFPAEEAKRSRPPGPIAEIQGLSLQSRKTNLPDRQFSGELDRLKDVEAGFDPELLEKAQKAGFRLILRINHDPWLAKDRLFADLAKISGEGQIGVLLNTDEIPAGKTRCRSGKVSCGTPGILQLFFEFHPRNPL